MTPLRHRPTLVIMVKAPVAGRVKTRLARGVGAVVATMAYRHMLAALHARLAFDARWQTLLAVDPPSAMASAMLPAPSRRVAQVRGDLGQRLQAVFDGAHVGPVVIIGTDVPAIAADDIARAFAALGGRDAVLGPADDGGYWLIGLTRCRRIARPFATVRWSGPHALADTLRGLAGLKVAITRTLADIDSAEDLARHRDLIGRRVPPR